MPLRAIAKDLIRRGYDVTFVTGSDYRQSIEGIGAKFISLTGHADLTEARIAALPEESIADPAFLAPHSEGVIRGVIDVMPGQYEAFQTALESMAKREPSRKIVALIEGAYIGALPSILGAPGIKPTGYVGIGIIPIGLSSVDTAPFGPGLPPDSSPEGRARNAVLNEEARMRLGKAQVRFLEVLKDLGASGTDHHFRDANYWLLDRFVQMCAPSFEYPRSDAPKSIQFAGGLLPGLRDPWTELPDWWEHVTRGDRKVVFVAQGTISMNPHDLIIPTMLGCKDIPDVLVVVALGKRGLSLPEGTVIPANTRVADFIPYDEMLEYTDIFVTNGGYGAVQHGLSHGVPLIVAGISADKAENAMRAEWSGVGLNLRTDKPTSEMVEQAVLRILQNPSYKTRAQEMKAEMKSYDPLGVIVENIERVAEKN